MHVRGRDGSIVADPLRTVGVSIGGVGGEHKITSVDRQHGFPHGFRLDDSFAAEGVDEFFEFVQGLHLADE